MSWGRQDDGYHDHVKILMLPLEAIGLEWLAISYANKHETDGFIPRAVAVHLARGERPDLFDALVSSTRWEPCEGGFQIHDFLVYNPSKAYVAKQRKRWRKNKAKSRGMSSESPRRHNEESSETLGRDGTGVLVLSGEKKKVRKRRRVAVPWPDDFTLTPERAAYAEQGGLDAAFEFGKFRSKHRSLGHEFVDWNDAWEYWCRNAWQFAQERQQRR